MARERDLFRAIVLAAVALVSTTPGCGGSDEVTDSGARDASSNEDASSGGDAGPMLADASVQNDASEPTDADTSNEDAGDDAMVLIL